MKLTLIILTLFASIAISNAQTQGDTKIVLTSELSEDELYKTIGQMLVQMGWPINKSEPTFKTLETVQLKFKTKSKYNVKQVIYVSVKDNQAFFTSKVKPRNAYREDATYQSSIPSHEAFQLMLDVAKKVGGNLTFDR